MRSFTYATALSMAAKRGSHHRGRTQLLSHLRISLRSNHLACTSVNVDAAIGCLSIAARGSGDAGASCAPVATGQRRKISRASIDDQSLFRRRRRAERGLARMRRRWRSFIISTQVTNDIATTLAPIIDGLAMTMP